MVIWVFRVRVLGEFIGVGVHEGGAVAELEDGRLRALSITLLLHRFVVAGTWGPVVGGARTVVCYYRGCRGIQLIHLLSALKPPGRICRTALAGRRVPCHMLVPPLLDSMTCCCYAVP